MNWLRLLPPGQEYEGPTPPYYFLILIAIATSVRSLIHMFYADGGAGLLAGVDVDVDGGSNIIAMFGQWGGSQLILALVYWLVILRYRSLTPLMLAIVLFEQVLRLGVSQIKPLEIATPPPGSIGGELLLPVAVIALIWSLWTNPKQGTDLNPTNSHSKRKKQSRR